MSKTPSSWQPPISPKQFEILKCKSRYLLVTGPRKASKTIGCLHDIPWRMWNTPHGRGMMLGRTTTDNLDGGAWQDLVTVILPQWFEADFGFELVTSPRMEALTHKMYFETTNKFDGVSRFYLDSLDVEDDAERKFKGKRFDTIYITELSNFKHRKTFDVLEECLRATHLRPDQHKLIADTNPAEEGEDSWIWKLWYEFRTIDLETMDESQEKALGISGMEEAERKDHLLALREMQDQLAVLEFTIDDNIYLSEAQKRSQRAKYAHNKDLYDRYYLGKWTRASGEGIFQKVWAPSMHIVGETPTASDPNPATLLPETNTVELGAGWDIGGRNVAVVFVEKVLVEEKDAKGQVTVKPSFKVLDEYIVLGENQKVETVVENVMEKIRFWEAQAGKKVMWKHWSDRSAFDRYDNIADTYEHIEVFNASNGEIALHAALKKGGSVTQRINLLQKLLFENRIFVAARCEKVIQMFNSIKSNRHGKLDTGNIYKHALDALSYYTCMECWAEMETGMALPMGKSAGVVRTRL